MDALQVIQTRRSVRRFAPQPVPESELEILLRAAMQAPSAGNRQPWHFIVIDERERLNAIAVEHSAAHMLTEAPVAVLVCADETLAKPDRWLLDCCAATENMLLAAHARGLGACWVGVEPVQDRVDLLRRVTGLPETIRPVALVAIGYAAEPPEPTDRYLPDRIHSNHW